MTPSGTHSFYYLLIATCLVATALFNFRNDLNLETNPIKQVEPDKKKIQPKRSPNSSHIESYLLTKDPSLEPSPALTSKPDLINQPPTPQALPQTPGRWDFSGSQLNPESFFGLFQRSEPSQIFYFTEDGTEIFEPAAAENNFSDPPQKIFFISSPDVIQRVANGREQLSNYYESLRPAPPKLTNSPSDNSGAAPPTLATDNADEIVQAAGEPPSAPNATPEPPVKLAENAFEVVFFKPGKRDNGETLTPLAASALMALSGPDYSLEAFDHRNEKLMRQHLSRILSLGNGGELLLQVAQNGYLLNGEGFDFALYENAMTIDRSLNVWQEFGLVGVSDRAEPESFRWFQCDPQNSVLIGCLGSVPTAQGGDRFDLAELGFEKIRYIWIKDIGISKNLPSRWPTEGCDIDAVRLFHAYTQ